MEDITNIMEDVEIVKEFLVESGDHLDDVESKILQLEENPESADIINSIFRPIHSIKGSAGFLGMNDIGTVSHELETLMDEARKAKIKITPEIIEILYEGIDILKKLREIVTKKVDNKDTTTEVIDYQPLLSKVTVALQHNQNKSSQNDVGDIPPEPKRLGEILLDKGMATPDKVDNALILQAASGKRSAETVKVDTQKLDNLVNLVGELVIANALINEVLGNANSTNTSANKNLSHLNKIVKDIQDQVMSMRMVPLKSTFQKMARLVRDVSTK